jgi:TRAP-type C4-dicarboxylate transport system substrate-binding protein
MYRSVSLLVTLTIFLFTALVAFQTRAEEIKLRMAIINVPPTGYGEMMAEVPDRIKKATGGRVTVEVFNTLIPGNQLASALRDGRVDMIGSVDAYLGGEDPRLNIGHLPGLIRNVAEYKFVFDAYLENIVNESWNQRYNGTALAHGLFYNNPYYSNVKIEKLEDFKGLKVRANTSESAEMLVVVGAKPASIAFSEIGAGLQRGVIDVVAAEYGLAIMLNLQDVAQYMQDWDFSKQSSFGVIINNDSWEKIPDDLKAPIRETMRQMQEERFANYHPNNHLKRKVLTDGGIEWIQISESEKARAFTAENIRKIYEGWYNRAATAGVDGRPILQRIAELLDRKLPD